MLIAANHCVDKGLTPRCFALKPEDRHHLLETTGHIYDFNHFYMYGKFPDIKNIKCVLVKNSLSSALILEKT